MLRVRRFFHFDRYLNELKCLQRNNCVSFYSAEIAELSHLVGNSQN